MMGTKMNSLVRVIADYRASFPDPIRVKEGDIVTLDFQKKTNISGWVWCTQESGKSGWIPESYLEIQGLTGRKSIVIITVICWVFTKRSSG